MQQKKSSAKTEIEMKRIISRRQQRRRRHSNRKKNSQKWRWQKEINAHRFARLPPPEKCDHKIDFFPGWTFTSVRVCDSSAHLPGWITKIISLVVFLALCTLVTCHFITHEHLFSDKRTKIDEWHVRNPIHIASGYSKCDSNPHSEWTKLQFFYLCFGD